MFMSKFQSTPKSEVKKPATTPEVHVVLPGFISLRKDKSGMASRGMHRYALATNEGEKIQFSSDETFSGNFLEFLKNEAVRIGGEGATVIDDGCHLMIEYISPTKAKARREVDGTYLVPTVNLCTELHRAAEKALDLKKLGRQEEAKTEELKTEEVKAEDVPF